MKTIGDCAKDIISLANVILMESEQGYAPELTTINELATLVESLEAASWRENDRIDYEALATLSKTIKKHVTKRDEKVPLDSPLTAS